MKDLIQETLSAGILRWLPCGEQLVNHLSKNDQLLVVRWRPISSDSVITEIYLDTKFIEKIQHAFEQDDDNLLESYIEQLEDYIVLKAENFENNDRHVWQLTAEILTS